MVEPMPEQRSFPGICHDERRKSAECTEGVLEEVERAKRFGFTQSELDRAKSQVLSNVENVL
jgi:zinc protease